jgi:hypothetical protein
VLELHRRYSVPAHIHLSGTLLEAVLWQQPEFLEWLRQMYREGLIEFVGSCYGQNIMPFFSPRYNREQLNTELDLYRMHLGVTPREVKTFWPPERIWNTDRIAPALTEPALLNGGYTQVLLDDRMWLPLGGAREEFDRRQGSQIELFEPCRIEDGRGLIALPIATTLRQSIPPSSTDHWRKVRRQLEWLAHADSDTPAIAIYADDMEKPAAVGWEAGGPARFEAFLQWVRQTPWVESVKLRDWTARIRVEQERPIQAGTFVELATQFGAGENYENWFYSPQWAPYREHFAWSERRVEAASRQGADTSLLELARKHLLASGWETAWHTPPNGAHGDARSAGEPSAWARALASHSRHAAVIAEAALWMRNRDWGAHTELADLDNDGEAELVIKNERLFAVFSARWGGRLIYLFDLSGARGVMVVGNPCDDWNLMEELNKCMETPRNHPGALCEQGFEHDCYQATVLTTESARMENWQANSRAVGLVKQVTLPPGASELRVTYQIPPRLEHIRIDFGLSPDYLNLLRHGRRLIRHYQENGTRGYRTDGNAVWVRPESGALEWRKPRRAEFGHGRCVSLAAGQGTIAFAIGVGV